jgi:hypothetical protein
MAEAPKNNQNRNNYYKKKKKNNNRDHSVYVPEGNPELLSRLIETIGLSETCLEILKKGNVNTIADLIKFRERELYRIQNFNKKNLLEVTGIIKNLGLAFRPEAPIQDSSVGVSRNINKPQPQILNRDRQPNPEINTSRENRIKVYADGRIDERSGRNQKRDRRDDRKEEKREDKVVLKPQRDNSELEIYASNALKPKKPLKPLQLPEEKLSPDALIPFNKDNKYGFKDIKGRTIIPPDYSDAFNYKEGLACVEKDDRYGYIDKKNNIVIPFNYDLAMSFSEGFACVTKGEKTGYIDKEGKEIIPFKYEAATSFQEGSARAKLDGKWGLILPDGTFKYL